MGLLGNGQGSSRDGHEVEHLRRRVVLFLGILLSIDLLAYLSDLITHLFISGLEQPTSSILRRSVTVGTAVAWLVVRFMRPRRSLLVALECGVTLALVLVYIRIATGYMDATSVAYGAIFATFGTTLLLSVRAAFVPSPMRRTLGVGVLTVASLFWFGRESIRPLQPEVVDGILFIEIAFVVVTALTSHVIYGLRREVSDARRLGQYTLEGKLGEGGMGTVYRASHAMLRRQAAVKLIQPVLTGEGARRAQALARFEREADVTATLKSPHTVELYDFGVSDEGAFYYVMELLEGVDLETAVTTYGPMDAGRVVYILKQVCESLDEAHRAGLVHRDIKPANLYLCQYGLHYDFVKVLDFGLVALDSDRFDRAPKVTEDNLAMGTPLYLAPEMASGSDPVDGRADIYSIGCVAYWLLTAQSPFERETAMATVLAHVNDTPPAPSSLSETEIPAALEAIILQCLQKRPEDRPASAEELGRRLTATVDTASWSNRHAQEWWSAHQPMSVSRMRPLEESETQLVTKAFE